MKKLYIRLSEREKTMLRNYAQKTGTQTYKKAIERLLEEDSVSALCIISAIEKNFRKTAVNYRQMKHYIQSTDPTFDMEITDTLYPAIKSLSEFTSSVLQNIQRGSGARSEEQIRVEDDTKEMLKQMKKTGCFRTYDALLRFMLCTHFEDTDLEELEFCFTTIKKAGHLFNQSAHSFHLNNSVALTELRQIMPEYQSALGALIEMIGDK